MIPGIMPAIRKKPAPGGGYSFTMTAGEYGFGINGYSNGVFGNFGSIDHEPIPGETLVAFASDGASVFAIAIMGDARALVEGLDVWVDGVPLGISEEWFFDGDYTGIETLSASPTFIPDEEYFIEIK